MLQKLLILDLDETLIHSREGGRGDFKSGPFRVTKRPFLDSFLSQVSQWYTLAVWTSASEDYAAEVVTNAVPYPLAFSWARLRCTREMDSETYETKWLKDLKKVKNLGYNLDHVLVFDDTPSKLKRHYGNLVRANAFEGNPSDTELKKAVFFFKTLKDVENVRKVEKRGWQSKTYADEEAEGESEEVRKAS